MSEPARDEREWTAVGEQLGAARSGETMWSGPFLKPGEQVIVVPKPRLTAVEAERDETQRKLYEFDLLPLSGKEKARENVSSNAEQRAEAAERRVQELEERLTACEPRGECPVCGGETDHVDSCEVGILAARVQELEQRLRDLSA